MSEIHDVIRTRRFELVDEEERVRVSLLEHDLGFITMRFFDLSGHMKMSIGLGKDGMPNVSLCSADAYPRLMLTVLNDGSCSIMAYSYKDEQAKGSEAQCFDLHVSPTGPTAALRFFDQDKNLLATFGAAQNQGGLCFFQDGQMVWLAPNDCGQSRPPAL